MADELPIFPKAESLFVDTGNIVSWNRLKKMAYQPASVEVLDSVGNTVEEWLKKADRDVVQFQTDIECVNEKFSSPLRNEDRNNLKLTVKLFACSLEPSDIPDVVKTVLERVGTDTLDTLLLALPPARLSGATLRAFWQQLEGLKGAGLVDTLGTVDLGRDNLAELCGSAEIKPLINQVNLESCCVMPEELMELAKEQGITLNTHSDPPDLVPSSALQAVLQNKATARDAAGWQPRWLARHTTVVRRRGIVHSRGYLLHATRVSRARPSLE